MEDEGSRPAVLREASTAIAYQRWLDANEFQDSDLNAWRFVAESGGGSGGDNQAHHSERAAGEDGRITSRTRPPRGRALAIAGAIVLLLAGVLVYGVASAEQWTKVDQKEEFHYIDVSDGTWHVTHENKDICFVGQDYSECVDEYVSEWNFACSERQHDAESRTLCDQYYDLVQDMKTNAAKGPSTVSGLVESGLLSITENTKRQRVVDVPESSHEAVCYLGFVGECPGRD